MFGRLLPQDRSFFDLFERHAAKTVEGALEFQSLVENSDATTLGAKAKRVKEIEHETDIITHQCVEALHKTFITPIDRTDIHLLITRMDDIMDYVEAAAERLAIYEIAEMTPEVKSLAEVLVRAAKGVALAVSGLRDMKNGDEVIKNCIAINKFENEADAILLTALARLFKEEKDPITVIKWKEIYENLENATDRCEDVANIIEGVVLENA